MESPPSGRAGYPVLAASSRALWWCQRAAAWCSLRRSDQRSAKASRARVISLAACCLARTVSRMVSAMDSLIGAMPAGQGWPPRSGTGASPRGICSSASLMPRSLPGARSPAGRRRAG